MADDTSYLKQKAQEWAAKVVSLYHTPVPPEYETEKRALLTAAKKIKDTVEYITGPLTALAAMNSMQLGVIPVVIGVVGVAGAVTLIVKWTLDYQTFVKKVQDRNKLIAAGMTPTQAANVTNSMEKQSGSLFGFDTKKLLLGLSGLGALFIFGRKQGWF